jgi:hypothetical protein
VIALHCRRCGLINLSKNGHTATGQYTSHCKDYNANGMLDTHGQECAQKRATVEKLHLEWLSQYAIARTTGMSCLTIDAIFRKRPDIYRPNDPALG